MKISKVKLSICVIVIYALTFVSAYAADRGFVISKINREYYTENMGEVVENIQKIDKTLDDDEYFKRVFECLDKYSVYYTKAEYEKSVISDAGGMISANILNDEIEVKIDRFGNGVEDIFDQYMDICAEKNIRKLTLDLSDCPGGYVHVMVSIANRIMPEGKIMTAKFKSNEKVYYSELKEPFFESIAVKISSKTASAAEILAAGLKESGAAVITGVNSYGKTSIQSIYRLENGGAFKLTCGNYLTRDGNDITEIGVKPDIVDFKYPVKVRWNRAASRSEKAA